MTLLSQLLFFDVSGGELLVIVLVVFLVFGPKKMPEIARKAGRIMNEMKKASNEITREFRQETSQFTSQITSVKSSVENELNSVKREVNSTKNNIIDSINPEPGTEVQTEKTEEQQPAVPGPETSTQPDLAG